MGIVVDEMGNIWRDDDPERRHPALPHPELEGADAKCPKCGRYKLRVKLGGSLGHEKFEWRCGCGAVFPDFHH